ncbi:hypothetical protein COCOBI_04-1530 [Coccomyxa sp. Obi]|nr:hypothetical protein COCOBI_04-1530 [Coccomyxa sp. Obi]
MPEGKLLGRVILTCPNKEEVLELPGGSSVQELLSKAADVFGGNAPDVLYVYRKGARHGPYAHGHAHPVEPGRDGIYSYGEFAYIVGYNGWILPRCIILGDPEVMRIYPTPTGAVYIDRSELGDWGTKGKPIPLEGLGSLLRRLRLHRSLERDRVYPHIASYDAKNRTNAAWLSCLIEDNFHFSDWGIEKVKQTAHETAEGSTLRGPLSRMADRVEQNARHPMEPIPMARESRPGQRDLSNTPSPPDPHSMGRQYIVPASNISKSTWHLQTTMPPVGGAASITGAAIYDETAICDKIHAC